MRIEKLHGPNIVLTAAKHNKREEPGGRSEIDPAKSGRNQSLCGPTTAKEVSTLAKSLMAAVGIDKAKTSAVRAVEFVFSLPPGSRIDSPTYFALCVAWVSKWFGGHENILSADVHNDEAAPHMHVLLLPLVNGRMNGSDMVGVGKNFQAHVDSFYSEVARKFGLIRPPAALKGSEKANGARAVLEWMAANDDPAMRSRAWLATVEGINRHPDKYMADLGIASRFARPLKTMEQFALSRGKGAKTEAEQAWRDARLAGRKAAHDKASHIGELAATNDLPLSCVGEVQETPVPALSALQSVHHPRASVAQLPIKPAVRPAKPPASGSLITRERDSDQPSPEWDSEVGEWGRAPAPASAQNSKAAAQAWVAAEVHRVRRAA